MGGRGSGCCGGGQEEQTCIYLWLIHVVQQKPIQYCKAIIPVAQTVKNLPAMQETRIQFLVWEDPLEKGMASHSNVLAWKIPWTEEPGKLQSAKQRVGHN